MPQFTQQQAQAYYDTLSPAEQSGVPMNNLVAWFTNAYNAGVPGAVSAGGGQQITDEQGYDGVRSTVGEDNSSEWLGKRNPTPSELRAWAKATGRSEDYNRFDDRQLAAWIRDDWQTQQGQFTGGVDKPTERGGSMAPRGQGQGYGGGGGGGRGGRGTYGGSPAFNYETFQAPSYEDAMADPGYQFSLREGADLLRSSQSARGDFRSSGSLKDLMAYGQDRARQQYGDVYGRAAQTHGINYQTAKDEFAPRYGSWQTQYSGNLQKYLNRENNIYGLLNTPPPTYPGY